MLVPSRSVTSYARTLLRLMGDESAQAMVEYCIVMGTLTILMMLAYKGVGSYATGKANNNANNLSNSSIAVP